MGQQLLEDAARLGRVVLVVVRAGQPVARHCGIRRRRQRIEQLSRFGCRADGLVPPAEPAESLRSTPQELRPDPAILPRRVEQGVVSVQRLLRLPRGQEQVGLEPSGGRALLGNQVRHGDAQATREEGERRHRGLREPALERADVGRGVSALGQLALRQGHPRPRLPNALSDTARHVAVIHDDDLAGPRARSGHGSDYTSPQPLQRICATTIGHAGRRAADPIESRAPLASPGVRSTHVVRPSARPAGRVRWRAAGELLAAVGVNGVGEPGGRHRRPSPSRSSRSP